jgi:hypothetical protein
VLSDRLLDDRLLDDRLLDGRPLDATPMVGFGAWLAGRLVPLAQRRCVYGEVERFLAWQNTALAHDTVLYDPAMQRPAVWCYLLTRQREGCDDAEAMRLWGALELFLSYVESQHVELRST